MTTRRIIGTLILLTAILGAAAVYGDEGMWPLNELNKLSFDNLRTRGLTLTPEQIYSPGGGGVAGAVVQVDGGTGAFLSADGLIITNHHVAYEAIQEQSDISHNYLNDGFYAATKGDEIPAIGYNAYVTLSLQDVTDRVLKAVPQEANDLQRNKAIESTIKAIVKAAEKGKDVKCHVAAMYGGSQYVLYTEFEIKDIRIVYIPPNAIGDFGGDIDNFMWPRQTGDFSFLRAYISPTGTSAEYAKDNVPYHPKSFLPISSAGVKEGDLCLILGFPGSTDRYGSSYGLANRVVNRFTKSVQSLGDQLAIINAAGAKDSTVALRMASDVAGYNNSLKYYRGVLDGCSKYHLVDKKTEQEKQLTAFLASNSDLQKKFGYVLPALDTLYQQIRKTSDKDFVLSQLSRSCDYFYIASYLYKKTIEQEKPDIERERGYQDRDAAMYRERMKNIQVNLVPIVDQAKLKYILKNAINLPAGQRIDAIDKICAGKSGADLDTFLDQYVGSLYAKSSVGNLDERLKMLEMKKAQLEKLNDPFIILAASLRPEMDAQRDRNRVFSGAESRLDPQLIQAYAAWKKGTMYPDANSTMRFNAGEVRGCRPRDGLLYYYLSGVRGVLEKETGQEPFIVPDQLRKTYLEKNFGTYRDVVIDDIPIDFLSTNDGTGGNSGSPVVNGKGELTGVVFDGNWESIASDYVFLDEVTRSINLDIRYPLWLINNVYHLDNLMKELTIH